MDVLSETMSRLCADITSLRRARHELRDTLVDANRVRKTAMQNLCHDFAATRLQMSKRREKERLSFITHLQRSVNQQRQALRDDLSGARLAWMGKAGEMPSRAAIARQDRQPVGGTAVSRQPAKMSSAIRCGKTRKR